MLDNKISLKIPERSLILLLTCLSGIVLFILIGLLPRQHALRALEKESDSLKEQLEVQRVLEPVYGKLKERTAEQQSTVLSYPQKSGLNRDRIAMLPAMLNQVAGNAGMQTVRVSPELSKTDNQVDFLFVNLVLKGDFRHFRNCLTGLGNLPFLERFEEIRIEQTTDGLEYGIRIKLAIG